MHCSSHVKTNNCAGSAPARGNPAVYIASDQPFPAGAWCVTNDLSALLICGKDSTILPLSMIKIQELPGDSPPWATTRGLH